MRIHSNRGLYDDRLFAPRVETPIRASLGRLAIDWNPSGSAMFLRGGTREDGYSDEPQAAPERAARPATIQPCIVRGCQWQARRNGLCRHHSDRTATCAEPGCDVPIRPTTITGRCRQHSRAEATRRRRSTVCAVAGCDRAAGAHGLCTRHPNYRRECAAEGCTRRIPSNNRSGLCIRHCGPRGGRRSA